MLKFFDADPGWEKFGSGIPNGKKFGSGIKHPGSTTLIRRVANPDHAVIVSGTLPDLEILRVPDQDSYVPFSTEARKFCIKKHNDKK